MPAHRPGAREKRKRRANGEYTGAVTDLFTELEAGRERLRQLVAGRDNAALAARPPSGAWSVVENLRHLLFAEQAHLGQNLPTRVTFSALSLPPPGMMGSKRVGLAGTRASEDATEVMAAWDAAHAEIKAHAPANDAKFDARLEKHLKHLRLHIGIIERLLRQADKRSP